MNSDDRIQDLEAKVAELTALVEQMTAPPSATPTLIETTGIETTAIDATGIDAAKAEVPKTASRRGMLKLAGAAAAGAVAATASHAMPAAALDADPILIARQTDTTAANRDSTEVVYTNTAVPQVTGGIFGAANGNMFVVRDSSSGLILFDLSSSGFPAAIGGYTYRTVANGIYGYTAMSGAGIVGVGAGAGSTGVHAEGARSNLELKPAGAAPSARTDAHVLGEVVCDTAGDVWICTVAGTPGTWRKVAGAATSGAFHALSPGRVYDSRAAAPLQGSIAGGQNRLISVADKRDPTSGAVTAANFVPAGATAVTANITVVSITGAGFLTVNPGGSTAVDSSTINWSAAGQILANGVNLTLNGSRQITVVAGGGGTTDFLIDISGYYL